MLPDTLRQRLHDFGQGQGNLVVMTGAGISAESQVPTFRGEEGYWTVGSTNYHPEEMATAQMFAREPEAVWAWYLYRRTVCRAARPNAGHQAVVALEQRLGDRFLLITQNVDGLHLRAGSSPARTYQIHGNIDYARCFGECGHPMAPLPDDLAPKSKGQGLTDGERALLRCACGGWLRPHVLWFDECYDEDHFRFTSSLRAATSATVLLVVGTSGATNLPMQVGQVAASTGVLIIDVNPEPNPFSHMAQRSGGFFLQGPSGEYLPEIVRALG